MKIKETSEKEKFVLCIPAHINNTSYANICNLPTPTHMHYLHFLSTAKTKIKDSH